MEVETKCHIDKIEKCTKQSALNAVRNVKYLSNLMRVDQSTVENATAINDHKDEDTKLTD
jgi:hypothetical protein